MAKKNKGGGSLQDQLKQAGLVTNKQLRKAQKGMHRQEMRVKQGVDLDEDKLAAQRNIEEKSASDRVINLQRNAEADLKALQAQIKQLIEMNSQRQEGDTAYNFTEENKVKTLYVSETNKKQLNQGFLAIVKTLLGYDIVPEKVARKIQQRSDVVVLYLYDRAQDVVDEDDPYKDFQIPDDLEW